MKNKQKVLVISPHADDAEVSMGGTIKKLTKEGHSVKLLVCIIPNEHRDGSADNEKGELRKLAQENTAKDLNVELEILDLDPYTFAFNRDLVKLLDEKIQEFSPDVIFTQWNHDSHQDHQAVSNATFAATRKNDITVLMYEQLTLGGITPYHFKSHIYVDISDSINDKLESVERYIPDTLHHKDLEAVKSLARFRGNQIGVEYAECFEVCKVICAVGDGSGMLMGKI
tara:strand:- start:1033 stop:1713 length:681 start_codon:yes stop_codon:yes gene_type:complete